MFDIMVAILLCSAWLTFFVLDFEKTKHKKLYLHFVFVTIPVLWIAHRISAPIAGRTIVSFLIATIFLASLGISAASDLSEMLIPRFCSIWLVPFWILFSCWGKTPVGLLTSITGAACGYLVPWLVAWMFWKLSGKKGLGEGDMELTAMVGSFLGPKAALLTLNIGAILAIALGFPYLYLVKKNLKARLPFAPALATGALVAAFLGY
jgi:prepilin signal peptidase PulO-like enzyme (type II secretory pathway)